MVSATRIGRQAREKAVLLGPFFLPGLGSRIHCFTRSHIVLSRYPDETFGVNSPGDGLCHDGQKDVGVQVTEVEYLLPEGLDCHIVWLGFVFTWAHLHPGTSSLGAMLVHDLATFALSPVLCSLDGVATGFQNCLD